MGSDKRKDRDAYDDELPQHKENIARPYLIGKYPVTNALFARFAEEKGYVTAAEQPDAAGGYVWLGKNWRQVKGANWRHPRGHESGIENLMDHPVVQVSWHDALAFCGWLTSRLRELAAVDRDGLPDEIKTLLGQLDASALVARLPSEAEWEKAARSEDGRIWPWGDRFDAKRCNSVEGGVGMTTAVGLYSPDGDSPYGCADMAGNVWEWCSTKWRDNYTQVADNALKGDDLRVVRGGSFYISRTLVRCAARNRNNPDNRNTNIGFRVVVAAAHGSRKAAPEMPGGASFPAEVESQRVPFLAAAD